MIANITKRMHILRTRRLLLYFILKPLDFALERIYLGLQLQVLRFERCHLRFQRLKLTIEREHLLLLLKR